MIMRTTEEFIDNSNHCLKIPSNKTKLILRTYFDRQKGIIKWDRNISIMWHQNKDKQSQLLGLFSQNSSREAKFAALTLQHAKFSINSEKTVLLIAYLQLASQIFLLNLHLWSSEPTGNSVSWFIVSAFKLTNLGSLFVFQGENEMTWVLLIISILLVLYKYISFLYILWTLVLKTECSPILIKTWKIVFQLQGRVLYSILSSIWVSITVKALQDELTIPGFGKTGTTILMIGFLLIEIISCFVLQLRYYIALPTKSLFSSKSPTIDTVTLVQKFILQILQIIFASISYMDDWTFRSVCIMFSLIRVIIYFRTLPVYSIKGLRYHGIVLMIITSLDITCFFQKIVLPKDELNFIMAMWIVLSLLLSRISHEYIHRKILLLAFSDVPNTSTEAIQKIHIIQQLRNHTRQHNDIKKDVYIQLINSTIRKTLINSYQEKQNPQDIAHDDHNSKDGLNTMFINYLESAQATFPKDEILKLYMAELWAKIQKYGPAMSVLANLQHSSTSLIVVNAIILVLNIQELMKRQSATIENKLNIYDYLKVQIEYMQVEKKILQQMGLQIDLYQEMTKDSPNLSMIFDQGQNIDKYRQRIEKEIKFMMNSIPDYYVNPLLICAYYYLVANNSLAEFSRLLKIHSHRKLKYAKSFQCENITPENCYQENNAFVLVSGQKESLGKICFCTESLTKIYGSDINSYLGANVSTIAPNNNPNFDFLSSIPSNEKNKSVIGHRFQGHCRHKAGYLIELEFYIDIFPILTNGFYYCILIRPISTERSMLVSPRGKSTFYNLKKEPPQVAENFNEENKPEELKNANNEVATESIESEEAENDYVKNSTVWRPDLLSKETARGYQNMNENIGLELLTSQRTESALLIKHDITDRKLPRYVPKKLESTASQDQRRENHKKDRYSITQEKWNKGLENPEQTRVSQTLNLALTAKFYWRSLRIVYAMFYLLLLIIVVAQVIMKSEINDTMNDLKTKKDILLNAQNRDYTFVSLARAAGFYINEVTGIFKGSLYSQLGVSVTSYLSTINSTMKAMTKANQNLEANAGLIAASLRQTLFVKDIRFFFNTTKGSGETTDMTNFQATDDLAQSILKALIAAKTNQAKAVGILRNVMYNSVNDLLIKTESTTQLLSDSIESDTENKQMIMLLAFIVFTVCLTIMLVILLRIIFLTFRKEKSNMLTLIKLDTNAISKLKSRLDTFKKLLETGNLTEIKDTWQSLQTFALADFQKKYQNRNNLQSANYGGTLKKYFVLIARYLICNYGVVSLIAWSSFSASNSIKSLHTEQVRMTFSNQIAKTDLLAYLAYLELYSTGGAAEIRNEPCDVQLNKAIDLLGSYRNEAISLFQNNDGEYDPLIGRLIFNPTCKDIVTTSISDTCGYLVKRQNQISLISILSAYQGLLTSMRESYYSSNKTLPVLQALQGQNYDIIIATHRVLLDECTTMTNRTNVIFQQKFSQAESQTTLILILILILVPVLGYGAWIFAFRQLQESDNKFKNVLKNFPANLLLSNFLLKAYLLNTSRRILEPIKSYL